MIPLLLYLFLCMALIILVIYSLAYRDYDLYSHIAAAVICSLIAAYLAITISVGVVEYEPTVTANTSWVWHNTSTYDDRTQEYIISNESVFTSTCAKCVNIVQDSSAGFILGMFTILMMVYSALLIYDAREEYVHRSDV